MLSRYKISTMYCMPLMQPPSPQKFFAEMQPPKRQKKKQIALILAYNVKIQPNWLNFFLVLLIPITPTPPQSHYLRHFPKFYPATTLPSQQLTETFRAVNITVSACPPCNDFSSSLLTVCSGQSLSSLKLIPNTQVHCEGKT